MVVNKKIISVLLGAVCIMLSGCSESMRDYNPLDDNPRPIDGYEHNNDYSWKQETNGYSDPYGEEKEQDLINTEYNVSANGLSMPADTQYFNCTIGNTVHFDLDQITLNEEAKNILNLQAQWLAQHHHKITIEGYADDRGTRLYNISLSKHRAREVAKYLISLGVPALSIKTVPYGWERPVALCQQEKCWSQNRRARIVLH